MTDAETASMRYCHWSYEQIGFLPCMKQIRRLIARLRTAVFLYGRAISMQDGSLLIDRLQTPFSLRVWLSSHARITRL